MASQESGKSIIQDAATQYIHAKIRSPVCGGNVAKARQHKVVTTFLKIPTTNSGEKHRYVSTLPRAEKAVLLHHLLTQKKMSRKDAASSVGLTPERVRQILVAENMTVKLPLGRPPATSGQTCKLYLISSRLNSALNSFKGTEAKTEAFRLALKALDKKPDLLLAENIGTDEEYVCCSITGLNQSDLDLIESLNLQLGLSSAAAVVRSAIEWLIDHHGLDSYRKPADWQSRPFHIRQAGSEGKNPMPRIGGDPMPLFLSLPKSLATRLGKLKAVDRAQRSSGKTRSSFIRAAIEGADWDALAPLTPEELAEPKTQISITITEDQNSLINSPDIGAQFETAPELLVAIIKQACDRAGL
jgi:hypothetical protein